MVSSESSRRMPPRSRLAGVPCQRPGGQEEEEQVPQKAGELPAGQTRCAVSGAHPRRDVRDSFLKASGAQEKAHLEMWLPMRHSLPVFP